MQSVGLFFFMFVRVASPAPFSRFSFKGKMLSNIITFLKQGWSALRCSLYRIFWFSMCAIPLPAEQ